MHYIPNLNLVYSMVYGVTLFVNTVFGACWLFIHIAEDITKELSAFNNDIETSKENRVELSKRFCDLIQVYSDANQLSHNIYTKIISVK